MKKKGGKRAHLVPAYAQHRSLVGIHRLALRLAPRADFIQTDLQKASQACSVVEMAATHMVVPAAHGEVVRRRREGERGDGVSGWICHFDVLVRRGC